MDALYKKLTQLTDLLKAIKPQSAAKGPSIPTIPPIRAPIAPSMAPKAAASTKMPGMASQAKKDPKKIAQQIKEGSMSTKTQKVMLKTDWSDEDIEKADKAAEQMRYHIHQGPHRITSEPVDLNHVRKQYGSVQRLEGNGFRLIPHKSKKL
jgi:hypothetical protein